MIKCYVDKAFLTLYILEYTDGTFGVRVNGKEVKKSYPTEEIAKQVAKAGARKLLESALNNLDKQGWQN